MAFTFSQCADEYIQNIGINPEDAARLLGGRNLIKQALDSCAPQEEKTTSNAPIHSTYEEVEPVSLEENSLIIEQNRQAREEQNRIWQRQAQQREEALQQSVSFADSATNEDTTNIPTMSIAQAKAAVINATTFGDFQQKMSLDDAQQIALIAQQSQEFRNSPEGEKFLSILDKRPSLYFEQDVSSNDLQALADTLTEDRREASANASVTLHNAI
ncbi:MAG: hypothetical protein CL570_02555 [Alphaproteobacteria bacterium]|nr:hypothetical protein [Alphaproteobacteria bacterium]|tara:strand:+ start:3360 stop:4004 length:645 start_codon:yes stop_codon:yes gene_type:complete